VSESRLDVHRLLESVTFTANSAESAEERAARLARETRADIARHAREQALFYTSLGAFTLGLVGSALLCVLSNDPARRSLGLSGVTSLGSALAGYLFGRRSS
jgi:hypothetical protein